MGRGEIMQGTTNTKGLLSGHMETRNSQSFLNCIQRFKWSYHIMEETVPQLDIICYQVKPLVSGMGYFLLSHWLKVTHRQSLINSIGYCQSH